MGGFGRAGPHSALRLRRSNLHTNLVERPSRRPSPRLHHPTPCPSPSSAPAPRSCPTACVSRKVLTTRASPPSPSRYVTLSRASRDLDFNPNTATSRALVTSIGSSPYRSRRSRRASRRKDAVRFFSIGRKPTWRGRFAFFGSFPFLRDWLRLGCRPEKRRFGVSRKSEPARNARQIATTLTRPSPPETARLENP